MDKAQSHTANIAKLARYHQLTIEANQAADKAHQAFLRNPHPGMSLNEHLIAADNFRKGYYNGYIAAALELQTTRYL